MSIVYADVRLGNDARPELEEINVTALVDTGALHLCIPEHVALQLRLSQKQPREVQTADGRSHLVPYVSPVKVSLLGRECVTGALVFGNQVLLGAIPMEDMDLIIEPSRQKVTVNPASASSFNAAWSPGTSSRGGLPGHRARSPRSPSRRASRS